MLVLRHLSLQFFQNTNFYAEIFRFWFSFSRAAIRAPNWIRFRVTDAACTHVSKILFPLSRQRSRPLLRTQTLINASTPDLQIRIWRSGVEALISVCVRSNGLDRCRDKGKSIFETWVQAASVTRNLIQLGALIAAREKENQNLNISA